jgi:hypothetical protein
MPHYFRIKGTHPQPELWTKKYRCSCFSGFQIFSIYKSIGAERNKREIKNKGLALSISYVRLARSVVVIYATA